MKIGNFELLKGQAVALPAVMFCAGMLGAACTKTEVDVPVRETRQIKVHLSEYDSSGQLLEGEKSIDNLQACIFEDGMLTAVYDNLAVSGSSVDLQIGSYSGTLYLLANTAGLVDLSDLQTGGISEDEWLRHTVGQNAGAPAHFFTGKADLGGRETTVPVSLERGVARFDLQLRTAGDASVSSLTLANSAQSAYLFPVSGELSPAGVSRKDVSVSFSQPLTVDTPGVLYVYEQESDGLEITVDAVVDGRHMTLTKKLENSLERNTIYTVTLRKDAIDVTLEVSFEDWIPGSDTELVPQRRYL